MTSALMRTDGSVPSLTVLVSFHCEGFLDYIRNNIPLIKRYIIYLLIEFFY